MSNIEHRISSYEVDSCLRRNDKGEPAANDPAKEMRGQAAGAYPSITLRTGLGRDRQGRLCEASKKEKPESGVRGRERGG